MSTHDRPARVAHEFQRELGDVLARVNLTAPPGALAER